MANPFQDRISRGAADFLFQVALLARRNPDDIRQFLFDGVAIWESLDRELIHPTTEAPHAHPL